MIIPIGSNRPEQNDTTRTERVRRKERGSDAAPCRPRPAGRGKASRRHPDCIRRRPRQGGRAGCDRRRSGLPGARRSAMARAGRVPWAALLAVLYAAVSGCAGTGRRRRAGDGPQPAGAGPAPRAAPPTPSALARPRRPPRPPRLRMGRRRRSGAACAVPVAGGAPPLPTLPPPRPRPAPPRPAPPRSAPRARRCGARTQVAARALTPKVACDFRDRLCPFRARYMFGAAALNGTVFVTGGLNSNDPTYPVPGSDLEAFDLATTSPALLPTVPSKPLNTTRYRQQLVPWGADKLLMVGGQFDDKNGASQKTMSMIVLDLGTREWSLRRQFWQNNEGARRVGGGGAGWQAVSAAAAGGCCGRRAQASTRSSDAARPPPAAAPAAELIWNWAAIRGDTLYMAVEDFGGMNPVTKAKRDVKDMGRSLFVYDLAQPDPAKDMLGSYVLVRRGRRAGRGWAGMVGGRSLVADPWRAHRSCLLAPASALPRRPPASPPLIVPPLCCQTHPPSPGAAAHVPEAPGRRRRRAGARRRARVAERARRDRRRRRQGRAAGVASWYGWLGGLGGCSLVGFAADASAPLVSNELETKLTPHRHRTPSQSWTPTSARCSRSSRSRCAHRPSSSSPAAAVASCWQRCLRRAAAACSSGAARPRRLRGARERWAWGAWAQPRAPACLLALPADAPQSGLGLTPPLSPLSPSAAPTARSRSRRCPSTRSPSPAPPPASPRSSSPSPARSSRRRPARRCAGCGPSTCRCSAWWASRPLTWTRAGSGRCPILARSSAPATWTRQTWRCSTPATACSSAAR
jgi:hypothetical protein